MLRGEADLALPWELRNRRYSRVFLLLAPAKALVAGLRLGQRLRRTPSTEAAEVQSTRPVAWMQTDKLLKNLSWSQTGTVASVASSAALAKPILGAEAS